MRAVGSTPSTHQKERNPIAMKCSSIRLCPHIVLISASKTGVKYSP